MLYNWTKYNFLCFNCFRIWSQMEWHQSVHCSLIKHGLHNEKLCLKFLKCSFFYARLHLAHFKACAYENYNIWRPQSYKPRVGYKKARGGAGDSPMSGIWVCATDRGRFFTSKNPEQAPIFEVLLQNRILFWQSGLKRQKCQLLSWKMTGPIPLFFQKICLSFSKRHWVCVCHTHYQQIV